MNTSLTTVLDLVRARTVVARQVDHSLGSFHGLGLNDLHLLLELRSAPGRRYVADQRAGAGAIYLGASATTSRRTVGSSSGSSSSSAYLRPSQTAAAIVPGDQASPTAFTCAPSSRASRSVTIESFGSRAVTSSSESHSIVRSRSV